MEMTKVDWLIEAYDDSKDEDPEWSGPAWDLYRERKAAIEKDLEVLEILKKHSTKPDDKELRSGLFDGIAFDGIDYGEMSDEEAKKVEAWLRR